jgi:phosphoribosyl-ATP pyrophosphohydrolase/phosphoribosyl-AMP cyclohydrolase
MLVALESIAQMPPHVVQLCPLCHGKVSLMPNSNSQQTAQRQLPKLELTPDWSKATRFEGGDECLLPMICQHVRTAQVLMLGYVNEEALEKTLESGEAVFWSRSRNQLWRKGETSGHRLLVRKVMLDCDSDTILALVEPLGPACHRNSATCFDEQLSSGGFAQTDVGWSVVARLFLAIEQRATGDDPKSYTYQLLNAGVDRVLRKLGEECTETLIAAKNSTITGDPSEFLEESADLLYHWLVSVAALGVRPEDVLNVLQGREGAQRRGPERKV